MKKVNKIEQLLKRILQNHDTYKSDWSLAYSFIQKREFEKLQELIKAIITKESLKPIKDKMVNYAFLIEAKVLIDEYVEQLNYEVNSEELDE